MFRQDWPDSAARAKDSCMSNAQGDLFGSPSPARPAVDPGTVAAIRKRMLGTLDMMKAAQAMPWKDRIGAILAENEFKASKRFLPPEEAEALWVEFDREMDRLYDLAHAAEEAAGIE